MIWDNFSIFRTNCAIAYATRAYIVPCRAGKMAGDIAFVNEADIGFLSAVSLPKLSQALLDNFLDSEHESEDNSEDKWSDFSDLSSGNDSSDMSGEELPVEDRKM